MLYFTKKKDGNLVKYSSETIYLIEWSNAKETWTGKAYPTEEDALEAADAALSRPTDEPASSYTIKPITLLHKI